MKEKNSAGRSDRFWTIPNILSIIRIVLIVPIIVQLRTNTLESNFFAFILIAIAYFTDFLDGFIARLTGSESDVGQILDPIGDKLLAITVSALLYFGRHAQLYLFVLILARDFTISIGAFYVMKESGKLVMPLVAGKVTTFVLGVLLACYPLSISWVSNVHPYGFILKQIVNYGTYLACFLLILSLILYINYYIQDFMLRKKDS